MLAVIHAALNKVVSNATAVGMAMLVTLLGDALVPVVSDKWLIDIKTAVSVGGTMLIATWWLSRKFQNIEDKFQNLADRVNSADKAREKMQEDLTDLIRAQRVRRPLTK
jgi:prefoldin subunit 5